MLNHKMTAALCSRPLALCFNDPSCSISKMATVNKKSKVDCEGRRFQDRWKLSVFYLNTEQLCLADSPKGFGCL